MTNQSWNHARLVPHDRRTSRPWINIVLCRRKNRRKFVGASKRCRQTGKQHGNKKTRCNNGKPNSNATFSRRRRWPGPKPQPRRAISCSFLQQRRIRRTRAAKPSLHAQLRTWIAYPAAKRICRNPVLSNCYPAWNATRLNHEAIRTKK